MSDGTPLAGVTASLWREVDANAVIAANLRIQGKRLLDAVRYSDGEPMRQDKNLLVRASAVNARIEEYEARIDFLLDQITGTVKIS